MIRALAFAVLIACHPTVAPSQTPSVPPRAAFAPPRIERFALPDGVQVLLVENHRLPLVAVAIVNLAAGSRADADRHGLAGLTADLLDEGAGDRDRAAFARALEHAGARLDIDIATDASTLELQVLPAHLAEGLALVGDALRRPRFDDGETMRVRQDRALRIYEHRDSARAAAAQRFDRLVFGDHPYAHPAEGDPEQVLAFLPDQIRAFHARAYGPATTTVIAAGDVDRATLEHALAPLADWRGGQPAAAASPVTAIPGPQLAFIDRPGDPTAVIVAGGRGQAASAPDRIAAELANTAFGGAPTARLDRRFHAELNLSLAASSSFWRGAAGGSWAIATTVQRADAKRAIVELRAQIAAARTAPFSPVELATAASQLLRALPKAFETDLGTARAVARLAIQGLPDDYYATFAARLARVTPDAALRAVSGLWTEPIIVVVGDRATLQPMLADLGYPEAP